MNKLNTPTLQTFTIRPYNETDFDAVVSLVTKNIPTYFAFEELNEFKHYLNHLREAYFVIELEQQIIGAGGINQWKETIYRMSWDAICPEQQRKGVGKTLLDFRINWIKSKHPDAEIHVRTSQLAYSFYQKNHFKLRQVKRNYWAPGFDLFWMNFIENK